MAEGKKAPGAEETIGSEPGAEGEPLARVTPP